MIGTVIGIFVFIIVLFAAVFYARGVMIEKHIAKESKTIYDYVLQKAPKDKHSPEEAHKIAQHYSLEFMVACHSILSSHASRSLFDVRRDIADLIQYYKNDFNSKFI